MSIDVVFQKLITMVTELTREVRDLREEFKFRHSSSCCQPQNGGVLPEALPVDLPLRTIEDLDHAEATLQLQEAKKTMVTIEDTISGEKVIIRIIFHFL